MKISFINAMAEACDASGADVMALARALALDDPRWEVAGWEYHALGRLAATS